MNTLHSHFFFSVISSDPSLGKIDKGSFSQETLMDLLIAEITNRENICGSQENPKDISEWKGVKFNDSNAITRITWPYLDLEGSIELKWLPPMSQNVIISWNVLTGTVDLTCLPDGLEVLDLGNNRFMGTVDLTHLPPALMRLYLDLNDFAGLTDFTQLPQSLKELNVAYTDIEGVIHEFGGNVFLEQSSVKIVKN